MSFNETGPMKARKASGPAASTPAAPGFNETGPMKARKVDPPGGETPAGAMLQ